MIQTLRIFRKKDDDLWAIFIVEFLKLVGCIVSDFILSNEEDSIIFQGLYDCNIFLNKNCDKEDLLSEYPNLEGQKLLNICNLKKVDNIERFRTEGQDVLDKQIIEKIWRDSELRESLKKLSAKYSKMDIFYYLYNKGNLKFVKEYYPISIVQRDINENRRKENRQRALELTMNALVEYYNFIANNKGEKESKSPYYCYAVLKMKYKLNEMGKILDKGSFFKTETMLNEVKKIGTEFPSFIRINYLGAKICIADNRFLWEGELYFRYLIKKATDLNNHMEDFLYYQFGKYYEKCRKKWDMAEENYKMAYQSNPSAYRAMYKLAQKLKSKKKLEETIIILNRITKDLLQDYNMKDLMPKQQIYIYKCFVLLGDVFFEGYHYDLAIKCYESAIEISETESVFFQISNEEINDYFKDVIKACMPQQPVYMKLISCSTKNQMPEKIKTYYEKLGEMKA